MIKTKPANGYKVPFLMMSSLFFMWGFITCMNDILIPFFKRIFELNYFESMMVQFCFFGAYFIGSLLYFIYSAFKGDPINKIGYQNGLMTGLLLSSLGCLLFYPAALYVSFPFFLSALFILGIGFTLLQICANPYVSILGTPETASARLNLSGGFNSLGTTIAPIIGGYLIFKYFIGPEYSGADSVKIPYLVFSAIFFITAMIFRFVKLPAFISHDHVSKGLEVLQVRRVKYGMLGIFMYVGAEVCIGSILISYLQLDNIAGFDESHASMYVAFYWGGLMIGRFVGGIIHNSRASVARQWVNVLLATVATTALIMVIAHYKNGTSFSEMLPYIFFIGIMLAAFALGKGKPPRSLFLFSVISQLLLLTAMLTQGKVAMWTVIAVGLFNSTMWPHIFTLAIDGLGKKTSQASSLLIMMVVGGAILPVLQGLLADNIGVHLSFIVPMLAYVYIASYGLWGYKKESVPAVHE